MCEQCHQALEQLNSHLAEFVKLNRELLQHQRTSIPKYLSQARVYQTSALTLNFQYHTQSQCLLNVTAILVEVTSPGTLVIADRQISVNGQQLFYFGPAGMLIRPEDLITLTQASAGLLALEFFGEELGDRGKRW